MADPNDDDRRVAAGCAGRADSGVRGGARKEGRATGLTEADHLVDRLRTLVAGRYITSDGSHDLAHFERVWSTARRISAGLDCDQTILAASCWLHDCVSVEKDSPHRAVASRLAAEEAARVLAAWGWDKARIDAVFHAIEAHSFSAGVAPRSSEAMVLRDADRLDALGAIGIARTFYVAGRLGVLLYDPADAAARSRPLDDTRWALDHFQTKLLRLEAGMLTMAGRREARARTELMQQYVDALLAEIAGAAT